MSFAELFEVGFFTAFYNFTNVPLSLSVWFTLIISYAAAYLLYIKGPNVIVKLILQAVSMFSVTACMLYGRNITGWDRLILIFVFGYSVIVWVGSMLAPAIYMLQHKRGRHD